MQSHHTTHTGTNPSHDPTNPAGTGATHMKVSYMPSSVVRCANFPPPYPLLE